jgi:hypothetical protein
LTKEELKEWIKRRGIVVSGGAGALAKARKEGQCLVSFITSMQLIII